MSEEVRPEQAGSDLVRLVETIEALSSKNIHQCESHASKLRVGLLADPKSAWALTYLSALRMKNAAQKSDREDFTKSDMLVRSIDEILAEAKEEKELAKRLKPVLSPQQKAQQRFREADEFFAAWTGGNPSTPSEEVLQQILSAQSGLNQLLGEELFVEVIGCFLSNRDANRVIPATNAVLAILKQLDHVAERTKYAGWISRREIAAKPKGILRKVDQKELDDIDQRLSALRAKFPELAFRDVFRRAVTAALPAHIEAKQVPKAEDSVGIRAAWESVAHQNADLAAFTHGALVRQKQDQLQADAEGRLEHRDRPDQSPANDSRVDAPDVHSGESILGEGDIQDWLDRQAGRSPS